MQIAAKIKVLNDKLIITEDLYLLIESFVSAGIGASVVNNILNNLRVSTTFGNMLVHCEITNELHADKFIFSPQLTSHIISSIQCLALQRTRTIKQLVQTNFVKLSDVSSLSVDHTHYVATKAKVKGPNNKYHNPFKGIYTIMSTTNSVVLSSTFISSTSHHQSKEVAKGIMSQLPSKDITVHSDLCCKDTNIFCNSTDAKISLKLDIFHAQNRLLSSISKSHVFYKEYVGKITDAFYMNHTQTEAYLEKYHPNDKSNILDLIRSKKAKAPIKSPSDLCKSLKEIGICFERACKSIGDLKSFIDLNKAIENILEHVDKGCLTNPDNLYVKVNNDYRLNRGTSLLESFHSRLKRIMRNIGQVNVRYCLDMLNHIVYQWNTNKVCSKVKFGCGTGIPFSHLTTSLVYLFKLHCKSGFSFASELFGINKCIELLRKSSVHPNLIIHPPHKYVEALVANTYQINNFIYNTIDRNFLFDYLCVKLSHDDANFLLNNLLDTNTNGTISTNSLLIHKLSIIASNPIIDFKNNSYSTNKNSATSSEYLQSNNIMNYFTKWTNDELIELERLITLHDDKYQKIQETFNQKFSSHRTIQQIETQCKFILRQHLISNKANLNSVVSNDTSTHTTTINTNNSFYSNQETPIHDSDVSSYNFNIIFGHDFSKEDYRNR